MRSLALIPLVWASLAGAASESFTEYERNLFARFTEHFADYIDGEAEALHVLNGPDSVAYAQFLERHQRALESVAETMVRLPLVRDRENEAIAQFLALHRAGAGSGASPSRWRYAVWAAAGVGVGYLLLPAPDASQLLLSGSAGLIARHVLEGWRRFRRGARLSQPVAALDAFLEKDETWRSLMEQVAEKLRQRGAPATVQTPRLSWLLQPGFAVRDECSDAFSAKVLQRLL